MTFSSATKTLGFYIDTPGIRKLERACGDRLTKLTQEELYQLCTSIALMLWGCCEPAQEIDPDDEFADLFYGLAEPEPDLVNSMQELVTPDITGNVKACLILLQNETPGDLSCLLPAVAEYARDRA